MAPLAFLILLIVGLSLLARDEGFLTRLNWKIIFQSTAVVAILAIGETAVIIAGEIDLAVGRVLAFAGVLAAFGMVQHHFGMWPAVGVSLLAGAGCGLVSGVL